MTIKVLDNLWDQYVESNPHVQEIYDLFVSKGEKPINDHIALRTLDDPRVDNNALAKAFTKQGYKLGGHYDFEVKKLKAIHLEPEDPNQPKVFISQLLIEEFSPFLQKTMKACVEAIPSKLLNDVDALLTSGATWSYRSYNTYQKLLEESEYAAWFYAFGYRANHFTMFINQLKNFNDVTEVNEFLKDHGVKLNTSGGEVKGTPADHLEQSSTLSGTIDVKFIEGTKTIPCCYFEFAKRYADENGKLYQGFVAKSADKIFESTNVKN